MTSEMIQLAPNHWQTFVVFLYFEDTQTRPTPSQVANTVKTATLLQTERGPERHKTETQMTRNCY